jgi:hypothetical protein
LPQWKSLPEGSNPGNRTGRATSRFGLADAVAVAETLEIPQESEVLATATPSAIARPVALDPSRPGPTDLLSKAQYQRYRSAYETHRGEPGEKHADAWRAAVAGGKE